MVDPPKKLSALTGSTASAVCAVERARGETVVPPGKYYLEGPISNPGSLTLQAGAEVYVHGDLDLSGAVRGRGSVIVDGATHLRGDVELAAGNKVALLSQGDVHLEGFDASGYLNGITGAPIQRSTPKSTGGSA